MSHVAVVNCEIKDLDALETAVAAFNARLVRDQRHFRMYGSERQPCLHAITGIKGTTYEIGLRQKTASDPETFELACDFFDGRLRETFGEQLVGLRKEYAAVVAERTLARRGYRVTRQTEGQQIRLVARA